MRLIVPIALIAGLISLLYFTDDKSSLPPSTTEVDVSAKSSSAPKSINVDSAVELSMPDSHQVESAEISLESILDINTEFPVFNASDADDSDEYYQPHNPLDTYETNPAQPLAALGTYVVDPKKLRSLDPEGTNYSSVWEIDLDAEFMNGLTAGELFSMPDLDNTGVNVILNDAEEVKLMVEDVEVRFNKHSGYPLANGPGFQFNLTSWEDASGNTQFLGDYNTRHGEYKIKSDQNGSVYLLQFDPEAHKGCNHAVDPHH